MQNGHLGCAFYLIPTCVELACLFVCDLFNNKIALIYPIMTEHELNS